MTVPSSPPSRSSLTAPGVPCLETTPGEKAGDALLGWRGHTVPFPARAGLDLARRAHQATSPERIQVGGVAGVGSVEPLGPVAEEVGFPHLQPSGVELTDEALENPGGDLPRRWAFCLISARTLRRI